MKNFKNITRITTNLIFAVLQFIVPFFHEITGIGKSIESISFSKTTPPEMPAGYAFSIWFVIFTLSIIYAVYQAFPAQRENDLFKKIGFYSSAAFFTSTLWMLIAQMYGNSWYLVIIIFAMLFFAIKPFLLSINKENPTKFERFIIIPLFGLFSGWLSIAVFLNLTSLLREDYSIISTLTPAVYALFTIIPASILAFFIIFKTKGNLWYFGAILWGLIAILFTNYTVVHNAFIEILTCLLILMVSILVIYFKKSKKYQGF